MNTTRQANNTARRLRRLANMDYKRCDTAKRAIRETHRERRRTQGYDADAYKLRHQARRISRHTWHQRCEVYRLTDNPRDADAIDAARHAGKGLAADADRLEEIAATLEAY